MQRYADIKQIMPEQGEKGNWERQREEGAGLWFKLKEKKGNGDTQWGREKERRKKKDVTSTGECCNVDIV